MTYTKEINGRQVFSSCRTIQTNEGIWISNPSEEQILAAGWVEYVPPVVEPEPQTEPDMYEVMAAVKKMLERDAADLSDEDALAVAALYPTWASKVGETVAIGDRLWYDGKLYKVVQGHTIQSDWTPDVTANLYTEVSIEEIPDWVQPVGASDAYNVGDKVRHNGHTWENTSPANVYEPGVFGWNQLD